MARRNGACARISLSYIHVQSKALVIRICIILKCWCIIVRTHMYNSTIVTLLTVCRPCNIDRRNKMPPSTALSQIIFVVYRSRIGYDRVTVPVLFCLFVSRNAFTRPTRSENDTNRPAVLLVYNIHPLTSARTDCRYLKCIDYRRRWPNWFPFRWA